MRKVSIEQYGSYAEQYVEGQHTAVWVISCRAVWGGSTLSRMGHSMQSSVGHMQSSMGRVNIEQYGEGQHRAV